MPDNKPVTDELTKEQQQDIAKIEQSGVLSKTQLRYVAAAVEAGFKSNLSENPTQWELDAFVKAFNEFIEKNNIQDPISDSSPVIDTPTPSQDPAETKYEQILAFQEWNRQHLQNPEAMEEQAPAQDVFLQDGTLLYTKEEMEQAR